MWIADSEMNAPEKLRKSLGPYLSGPMLSGHGARVWDCSIYDSVSSIISFKAFVWHLGFNGPCMFIHIFPN